MAAVLAIALFVFIPYCFYEKSGKDTVPYVGENLRKVKPDEVKVLQNIVADLFVDQVVNDGDRVLINEYAANWKSGESFQKMMEDLIIEAGMLPSIDFYLLKDKILRLKEDLKKEAKRKICEYHVKMDIRTSRIAIGVLLSLLKNK